MATPAQEATLQTIWNLASRYHMNLFGQVDRGIPIARGRFAVVYQGTLRQNGTTAKVALKVPCGYPPGDVIIRDVLREVHTWSDLCHENVLELLGITTEFNSTLSMVYRWVENGTAHCYVQDKTVDPRPILQGISHGLHYLHSRFVFHGDLKGSNVLISAKGIPLLTDFGFSHLVNSSFAMPSVQGPSSTLNWLAPEDIGVPFATAEGDVWAFGMTALELFTRKVPFHECIGHPAVISRILYGPLPEQPNPGDTYSRMTTEWWDLCCQCWERQSSSRPKTATIIQRISNIISHKEQSLVVPHTHSELSPTINHLTAVCPRFRILVIGKSRVGKSSLIRLAFGITEVDVVTHRREKTDIEKELIPQENSKVTLHDSDGLGLGECQNYSAVTSFIQYRTQPDLDLKEQLHAVWICLQIPLLRNGELLIDTGMEEFLSKKREILGNVPAIFVFTKYDKLIDVLEDDDVQDPETAAAEYLEKYCVQPLKKITQEDIPCIAVSKRKYYHARHKKLIELTSLEVSKRFAPQPDGPSPVSVATLMAQIIDPGLKVDGLIAVGKRGYWKALATTLDFSGYTIWDCLRVIHVDVTSIWNFHDPSQYLVCNEFRELMVNMVRDIQDDSDPISPLPTVPTTWWSRQRSLASEAPVPIKMPFIVGLALTRWVYNTYRRIPLVQRIFMTYIVDLVNVLKTLFPLVANRRSKLTRRLIKLAYSKYYESWLWHNVHNEVKALRITSGDLILEKIESLVRSDNGFPSSSLSLVNPEQDEEWHVADDDK